MRTTGAFDNTVIQNSASQTSQLTNIMESLTSSPIDSLPPELLEMTLLLLSNEDVGNMRVVSRTLCEFVDSSKKLNQKLFLEADHKKIGPDIYVWTNGFSITPMGHFGPPQDYNGFSDFAGCDIARPVVVTHPKFTVEFAPWPLPPSVAFEFPDTLETTLSWPQGERWEKTLVTQPPRPEMTVFILDETRGSRKSVKVDRAEGVTFGAVVAKLRSLVYPRGNLSRAAKVPRPEIDVRAFGRVVGFIDGVMLPDCDWIQSANEYESWMEECKADRSSFGEDHTEGDVGKENGDIDMADESSTPAHD